MAYGMSTATQRCLIVALASRAAGKEVADSLGRQATYVANFGSTTNIPAAACAGGATPSATNVNTAIDAIATAVEARLDAIEAKVNAGLTALKNATLMAAS